MAQLKPPHEDFYDRLTKDQRNSFAMCVAEVLNRLNLLEPSDCTDAVYGWFFGFSDGWSQSLKFKEFEERIIVIAREAVATWRTEQSPLTRWAYRTSPSLIDKVKTCCGSVSCNCCSNLPSGQSIGQPISSLISLPFSVPLSSLTGNYHNIQSAPNGLPTLPISSKPNFDVELAVLSDRGDEKPADQKEFSFEFSNSPNEESKENAPSTSTKFGLGNNPASFFSSFASAQKQNVLILHGGSSSSSLSSSSRKPNEAEVAEEKRGRSSLQQMVADRSRTFFSTSSSEFITENRVDKNDPKQMSLKEQRRLLADRRDKLQQQQTKAPHANTEKELESLDQGIRWIDAQCQALEKNSVEVSSGVPDIKHSSATTSTSHPSQGYLELEIPGDGDCLYSAVALYVGQDQQQLRNQVADKLETKEYKPFLELASGQTAEAYIGDVRRRRGEGAGQVEIRVLMSILQRPIIVIRPGQNAQDRVRNPDRSLGEDQYFGRGVPIPVKYNGHNHYDALVMIEEQSYQLKPSENQQSELQSLLISNNSF